MPTSLDTSTELATEDRAREKESAEMGMWIFIGTEILFFGGLILVYSTYRTWYPIEFMHASNRLDLPLGTINTFIILTSSLFMSAAIDSAREFKQRTAITLYLLTALLACAFIAIKGYEWYDVFREGLRPIADEGSNQDHPPGTGLFFALYYVMTGLHGLHVVIGIGLILTSAVLCAYKSTLATRQNVLTCIGLYWHFVDIVWVFLFPLLYLAGRSIL